METKQYMMVVKGYEKRSIGSIWATNVTTIATSECQIAWDGEKVIAVFDAKIDGVELREFAG